MHASACLVQHVDGLVGKVSILDVLGRKFDASNESLVGVPQLVVRLILARETLQDPHSFFNRGFRHLNGLETALKSLVLFHIFAVFLRRGGSNDLKFAAGQCRFHDVGSIDRASTAGATRSDQGVDLIDHEDDVLLGLEDLLDHVFQALLKLAAILGASQQPSQIKLDDLLPEQHLRHVASGDAVGQAFSDGRFAHSWLSDQHGVVLLPPSQDLNRALDLLCTADQGVHHAVSSHLSEVSSELHECRILGVAASRTFAGCTDNFLLVLLLKLLADSLGDLRGIHVELL
mmetsp:Transcript_21834/g.35000  ORF Transcript_21834/g.35000 Transcript_21834/m.35000 type:complete len:288 (+) Transcript_21834:1522-2385(+)